MPRTAILKEMRPSGAVRPAIQDLADQAGAYVIVSSTGSTSESALGNRRKAMTDAVSDMPNANSLALDFYDRNRIATWVRDHPGLIPWVREKIGKAIPGWRPYGPWAYAPEGVSGEYLVDDSARIQTGAKEDGEGISTLEGIRRMREILRTPGKVVRLVGLSGVGKTRLVQVLFDERVDGAALDPSLAFYTNMVDGPDPQPTGLASDLVAARTSAILVVDNCAPDLHRRLSELCRSPGSTISAVTVEYDIREDEPEGTEVFSLEPSSLELVERLVRHRFPEVSTIDAHTVAEFSGGNARIAIALAATIGKNETIAGLNDEELFERLFEQRHGHDPALLLTAQACSLVYSFQGEDISSNEAELPRLAALVAKNAQDVFRDVAELGRRDLVQRRSVWRAVLPHAIANRLAKMALQSIPRAVIEAQLVNGASVRLMRSFSRRLGYLDDSADAIGIAERWLSADGLLGDATMLNEFERAMFHNVAPVAMGAALGALERALDGPKRQQLISQRRDFVLLVRSIAYDPKLFDRSAALLIAFAIAEEDDNRRTDMAEPLTSLFHLYLSGTHASIEQRLQVVKTLLQSNDPKRRGLGIKALSAVLEAWHFRSSYSFDFGAHSRDHGYWPRSRAEVKHWFSSALNLVEMMACSDGPAAAEVRAILAQKFRGLWTKAGMYDELERVCQRISAKQYWREGWIAIRETLRYDAGGSALDARTRLAALDELLRPKDLIQKVRFIVLSGSVARMDFNEFEQDDEGDLIPSMERTEALAEALGKETAQNAEVFSELVPELVFGGQRLWPFGRGLAVGAQDPEAVWKKIVAQLAATQDDKRNVQVLRGFLNALRETNPHLSSRLLDDAVENQTLAPWFPVLQIAAGVDELGLGRLRRALARDSNPVEVFRHLAWGRPLDSVRDADFKELVTAIAAKPGGLDVAVEILAMRLHADNQEKRRHPQEVIAAGRMLMDQLSFGRSRQQHDDYKRAEIVTACLTGQGDAGIAHDICCRLKHAVSKNETYALDNPRLMQSLLRVQPAAVLDALFAGTKSDRQQGVRMIEEIVHLDPNPLDAVQTNDALDWCDRDPSNRYPTMASVISLFRRSDDKAPLQWTDAALRLLEKAPDRVAALKQMVRRFSPTSWSGSRAAIIEARARLLNELDAHPDATVVSYAAAQKIRLAKEVEEERRRETERDKAADERFE
jgi:hypothetical protein